MYGRYMSEKLSNNGGTQEITDTLSTSGSLPSGTEFVVTYEDLNTTEFKQSPFGVIFETAVETAYRANDSLDDAKQLQAEVIKIQAERDKIGADRAKGINTGKLPIIKGVKTRLAKTLLSSEKLIEEADEIMPSRQLLSDFVGKKLSVEVIDGVAYEAIREEEIIDGKVRVVTKLRERIGETSAEKKAREKKERKAGSVTGKVSIFDRTRESEKHNADRIMGRPWRPVPKEIQWDDANKNPGTSFEPSEDTED